MVILWLPFVVCIVGLLIYLLVKPELNKVAEVGRIMFAFGLLVTLLELPNHFLSLTR